MVVSLLASLALVCTQLNAIREPVSQPTPCQSAPARARGQTFEMANIAGPGALPHIWLTPTGAWRASILRIYWDGQEQPSVECPLGDFFASGWGQFAPLASLAVCVNPGSGFNCYWEM